MTGKILFLAGGAGERLKPLTATRPKPLARLASKPILLYGVDQAVRAGYNEIFMAVEYVADKIMDYFGDGSEFVYNTEGEKFPLKIRYAKADSGKVMAGTADALRKSRLYMADGVLVEDRSIEREKTIDVNEYMNNKASYVFKNYIENFTHVVVCSGDILSNFDLTKLIETHKKLGGFATIALYEMDDKNKILGNFGTVEIGKVDDNSGKIKGFTEKPKTLKEVKSNLINTGTYVFDREIFSFLDKHKYLNDFGNHVFPELLAAYKDAFFGTVMKGYWNDVGTIQSFRETNLQLIDGIEGIDIYSMKKRPQENSRSLGTIKHSLMPQGLRTEKTSLIEDSVISNDVYIGDGVELKKCIVMHETKIKGNTKCENCIIDSDVEIEKGAQIGKNVVIGSNVYIKSGAKIQDNTMIYPGEIIDGEVSGIIKTENPV